MEEKNYYEELMEKYDNWGDLVKDLIIERLEDYKGQKLYLCDLAYTLFESENVDGSFTYSTYWSKQLIKNYFDDFREMYEDYIFHFGEANTINIFYEPERFIVVMLLEKAQTLLSNYYNTFINDNWNNEIELNEENIKKIVESLEV